MVENKQKILQPAKPFLMNFLGHGCVIQLPFQGGDALVLRLTANFGAGGAARAEKRIKRYISVSVIVPDGGKARRYPRDLLGQVSRVESAYDKTRRA